MSEPRKTTVLNIDSQAWYTAGEAAKVLSANSGRQVKADYVSKLGWLDKIRTKKVHARLTLYSKQDVDAYKVEPRGKKSGAAKKAKAAKAASKTKDEPAA